MIQLIVLAVAAFVTSIISGILGMGGGILLLAVVFSFLPHAEAVPAHGAVQLVAHLTRLAAFTQHVDWKAIRRFVAGALPGSVVGALLVFWLRQDNLEASEPYFKIAVGLYILVMTFRPTMGRSQTAGADDPRRGRAFTLFGFLGGVLGLTMGAVGPLIAPLFIRGGYVKERLVATKTVCEACIHLLKIPLYLLTGFVDYRKLTGVIAVMAVMVIPGTLIGKRILSRVDERMFVLLFKAAMLLAGGKVLFCDGLYKLLSTQH